MPNQITELSPTSPGLEAAIAFSWALHDTSYPLYETESAMRDRFARALTHTDDKVLTYRENGALLGVLIFDVTPSERYSQSCGVYTRSDSALAAFLEYVNANYAGFETYWGFPRDNAFFGAIGAEIIERTVRMTLVPADFIATPPNDRAIDVTRENFDAFAAFHDARNTDMYWTGERLRETFDDWKIYVSRSSEHVKGCVLVNVQHLPEAEIYALTCDTSDEADALMSRAMTEVFALGAQSVLFLADEEGSAEYAAAVNAGFRERGRYVCYRTVCG
ncbi:MAG: hypothetical protein LBN02_09770 [Oscillospiraceae bacterium]|jgi:hypothetical protein|nr:hypothetical protein [Oscillospiraceae bacterium]